MLTRTMKAARNAVELRNQKLAEREPLVLAVLQQFPGAEIVAVRPPGPTVKATVDRIVRENVAKESKLHTDESRLYGDAGDHFAEHETVKHSADEYVRYKDGEKIHTNTAEGYFSIFKRGMKGVYQHCSEKHLHRYLAEFDFRYNARVAVGYSDQARAGKALRGMVGKRLTYRAAGL